MLRNAMHSNIIVDNRTGSIELDGVSESLRTQDEQPLGISNAWTAAVWVKALNITTNSTILNWRPAGADNHIQFSSRGEASPGRIRWQNTDTENATIKRFDWDARMVLNAWEFHVATWDGTDLVAYKDGSPLGVPDIVFADNSGTMSDSPDRRVAFGSTGGNANHMNCRMNQGMMWSEVLDSDAILTVWNGGNGSGFDPSADSGSYTSSSALQHWWRFGNDREDIGGDFGIASTLIDLFAQAANISTSDIVADMPV